MTIEKSRNRFKNSHFLPFLCLSILAIVMISPNFVSAETYYLDVDGVGPDGLAGTADDVASSDDNPGTSTEPWKTLSKAKSTVVSGDTIILRSGNYGAFDQQYFSYTDWVTYRAEDGQNPIFSKMVVRYGEDAYLKFDGIDVQIPGPLPNANDPPWDLTTCILLQRVNYVELRNMNIVGLEKYLTDLSVWMDECDDVTIYHCDARLTRSGFLCLNCNNLVIDNIHLHETAGGSGLRVQGDTVGTVITNNHIHDCTNAESDTYFPPDKLYLDPAVYPQGNPPALTVGEEIWSEGEYSGKPYWIKGTLICAPKWTVDKYVLYIRMITMSEGWYLGLSKECEGQTSKIVFTYDDWAGGFHTGSALSIRSPNTTIRGNIIHYFQGQGLKLYTGALAGGYSNMVIENNLIYDVSNGNDIHDIGGSCVVRNNLFIRYLANDGLNRSDILQRYPGGICGVQFHTGFNGIGFEFFNNIIIGKWELPDPTDPAVNQYAEDYNMWWSRWDGSSYVGQAKGANSLIVSWREDAPNYSPRGWPNYFTDIGYNVDIYGGKTGPNICTTGEGPYDYDYSVDGITPFFVSPGFFHTQFSSGPLYPETLDDEIGSTWDYRFAAGSPGINFGDVNNQPSDSLGSVGPDGFLKDDGQHRDVDHHSAGCYEYSSGSGNSAPVLDSIGNKSVNEGSALSFSVSATDADGDAITYSATGLPSGATFSSHTFSWTPGQGDAGDYNVTFIATDDGGLQDSKTITIAVDGPPTIVGVTANSPVRILFSEPLDQATAETISNYSISPGITINSARLDVDLRTVILDTSDHQEGIKYTLTVNGVKDLTGNAMPPTTWNYQYSSDSTGPVISNVQATEITTSGATIIWTTDENSTSQVEYGLDSGYGNVTNLDSSLVTSHSVGLPGLTAETNYHYRIRSTDSSGQLSLSQDYTFMTTSGSVNHSPVANSQSITLDENNSKNITLTANDPDGDTLNWNIETQPGHGVLSGTAPNLTYTPSQNYNGSDSFTFKVNDAALDSNIATVSITVNEGSPPISRMLSITDVSVVEGNAGTVDAVFTVNMSPASESQVTVDYNTSNGTATLADNDYELALGVMTFLPGVTEKTIIVKVNGDTKIEPAETFFVNLSNASSGVEIVDGQGLCTIEDDGINTYALDVTAINGSVSKTPNQATYNYGDTVTLSASTPAGYNFVRWSGDLTGSDNPATITMNGNKSITAICEAGTYTLAVSATNGTITKSPDQASYNHNSSVTLTATPVDGYHFTGWLGDLTGSANPAAITMDSDKIVSGNFAIDTHTITASAGQGGSISPGGTTIVDHGSNQVFVITPDTEHHIVDVLVDGIPQGAINSYAFNNISMDHTIMVTFEQIAPDDQTAPTIKIYSPSPDVQAPLNTLIILHVDDGLDGAGVDINSVVISVDGDIVYTDGSTDYISQYGRCRREGTKANYIFTYQPTEIFDFDQTVDVTVNARDLVGNVVPEYTYSFKTQMRSFGGNMKVNSTSTGTNPVTVQDSKGNVWVAWEAGPVGNRNIYVAKLPAGSQSFENSVQITNNDYDQCNPTLAIDNNDKLYLAWQENPKGNWNIYFSMSTDGTNWTTAVKVANTNANQTNPVLAVDSLSPNQIYLAWQDDRKGNYDIYIASSSDDFATKTMTPITTDNADQTEPAIAIDSDNTVYLVWTDARNGSTDIYGAASNKGPWTNVPIVNNSYNQSFPAIAVESHGNVLHLLWVDDTQGNKDIYYAATSGSLPDSPLTGVNIVDDSSAADQSCPAIVVSGSSGDNLKIYACWQDDRNVMEDNNDTDIYFAESTSGGGFGTNIWVSDNDFLNAGQQTPVMNLDDNGNPEIVWVDSTNGSTGIHYAGTTLINAELIDSKTIIASQGGIVGADPNNITSKDDVSLQIPAGALWTDAEITIHRVDNPPTSIPPTVLDILFAYEFGPSSNIEFSKPVTITIPYSVSGFSDASVFWFNPQTGQFSQSAISNIEHIVISDTLCAIRYKTTHFTQYVIARPAQADISNSSGGGGCSILHHSPGSGGYREITEFFLPYIALFLVIFAIRQYDAHNKRIR